MFLFSLGCQEFYYQLRILITCIEKLLFFFIVAQSGLKLIIVINSFYLIIRKKVSDFILCIYPQYDKITRKGDLWMNKNDIISQEENELDYF